MRASADPVARQSRNMFSAHSDRSRADRSTTETSKMVKKNWILTFYCQDRPRIVSTVTTAISDVDSNILESAQFWDRTTNRLFMRIAFETPDAISRKTLESVLNPVLSRSEMNAVLVDAASRPRVIIMVSKSDHCLRAAAVSGQSRLAESRGRRDRVKPPRLRSDRCEGRDPVLSLARPATRPSRSRSGNSTSCI